MSHDPALRFDVPQLRRPRPGLITGGQPDASAWRGLKAQGVTTVINLRTAEELAGRDVAAEVAAAGMRYHAIPVAGAAGINGDNAAALRALLEDANGTVLVHCASGNRVGGLIALGAAQGGLPAEQALELGKAAGLTGAEAQVRQQLGLSAE
ncbi:beta-lactamase hydrolase domain-containing protein [Marilutibacter chinensis]|uniref:Sulfur transferase domain-containing protein n=1 Tax=Marilutibacter chinensis TaxID=2912247 RepID=A0ABS9HWV0_9GAMM|nr:sulfur transferase domain-containing protein [Lysobacter chinensis]MCF7223360.1 sulfur transferase domain-containing protein [Lysobacter chinensis]